MSRDESSAGRPQAAAFATTQWSVVLDAKKGSFEALETLCASYRRPLLRHLLRKGMKPHLAEDLLQDFFKDKFLRETFLQSVGNAVLVPGDIRKPEELAAWLSAGLEPVSAYLWETFSEPAREACRAGTAGRGEEGAEDLRRVLSGEFNRLIAGEDFRGSGRFGSVALSEPTRALLESGGGGSSRVRMNRLLLDDACRGWVARSGGRFRTFVLTALDRFFISKAVRVRPDPSSPDVGLPIGPTSESDTVRGVEPVAPPSGDVESAQAVGEWAEQVLVLAGERHRQEYLAAGKPRSSYEGFEKLHLGAADAPTVAEFAGQLGINANALYVAKHRFEARRRFWLRQVVKETVADSEDWEDEVRALLGGLAG